MANNERSVDLKVRGRDDFTPTLNKLEAALKRTKTSADRIQLIKDTRNTIKAQRDEYTRLSDEVDRYSAALAAARRAGNATESELDEVADAANLTRGRMRDLATQTIATQAALSRGVGTGGFKAFNQIAIQQEAIGKAARQASADAAKAAAQQVEIERVQVEAYRRSAVEAQRKADIQERLNQKARSGFNDWSRYADTIARISTDEQRASAIAERKAAIQERLNQKAVGGFVAWSRNADGLQATTAAANQTVGALNKLDAAQDRVNAGALRRQRQVDAQRNRPSRGSASSANDSRRGEDQDVELYGLRPYQMVNLGYQVNDVVSGLAMGQAPVQILAQQAGQVAQIWPQMMVGIVRSLPQLAALAAVLAPVIVAIRRTYEEAENLRVMERNLAFLADGSRYSAAELANLTKELTRNGIAVDAARASVLSLVKEGFDQSKISQIANMARELSKFTGKSYEDEIARLGEAFSGSTSGIRELDRELQFLTADQLAQITAMDKSGDSAGAVAMAQDLLRQKLVEVKRELNPTEQAAKNLGDAWNTMIDALQDSSTFRGLLIVLGNAAKGLERVTNGIDALAEWANGKIEGPTFDESITEQAQALRAEIARLENWQQNSGTLPVGTTPDMLDGLKAALADIESLQGAVNDSAQEEAAIRAASTLASQITATKTQEQLKNEQDLQLVLDKQLESMREETAQAGRTSREQFIQNKLLEAKKAALDANLQLTKEETAALQEAAGALFDTQNSAFGSGNYGGVVDRIVGVESGGNANAKNPLSSATGLGQFIESTWLSMFKQYFPDRAESMSKESILALRTNADLSRQMVELYARENAKVLQAAGVAVTDASVYLSHFLGPQGALKVMQAAPNTPVSQLLGAGQINANRSILEGQTAGGVIGWAQQKMGVSDQEVEAGQTLLALDVKRAEELKKYNEGYAKRAADQRFELEMAQASAREAAIQSAIRKEEVAAQEAGLTLTKAQRDEISNVTAALFDRENAETRVNELLEQRKLLGESLEIAQNAGDGGKVQEVVEQIRANETALNGAITAAIAFYQSLGGPAADLAIQKLQNLQSTVGDTVQTLDTQFLPTAADLNEQLADIGGDAFNSMAEAIANGESALDAFWAAARQGVGQFLIDLGMAIVKQQLFNALSGGAAGGGAGGFIAGLIGTGTRHGGGMVGAAAKTRMVDPAMFAGANRHHGGGLVGREVPIIALEDEEVLTRDDDRHVLNGGKGRGGNNVKIVNVLDPAEIVEAALATEPGQRVMLNFMAQNPTAVKGAMGN